MNATAPPDLGTLACYVYGIVPSRTRVPDGLEGVGDPPAPVSLVKHHRIAAVVSEIDTRRPLGTPTDLLAHARVLDTLAAARCAVLPFRFGAVVGDVEEVADDLLAPQERRFLTALEDLTDLAQFTVRGTYRQEWVLRRILGRREDIARLREQTAALPADAARHQNIQLGELVSQELVSCGRADTTRVLEALSPLAAVTLDDPATADQAVNVSFLVPSDRWDEFEGVVEDLAGRWEGQIELRLLGPLAAYDFVSQAVDAQGGGPPWE
ncbi:GvpL/GvpF family gas vesicle protein [Kitasatospora sp. NPDC048365]|uniref:GvpL/GvpF family gas vesicle protein n=1 Tax=Kitasatospora sp. NPDC048365 TaxID=3364050 RepID=UPI00371F181F